MNKGKKSLSARMNKKVQKEVKKGLQLGLDYPATPIKREFPRPEELLKTQPKRKAKMEEFQLHSMEKAMEMKKAKRGKKHSKRTQTHDDVVNSAPAHVHAEGTRWIKTLTKQGKAQSKISYRKSAKNK